MGMRVRDITGALAERVHSEDYLQRLESLGPGYTGIADGKIIGCIVFCQTWPGVAEPVALFPEEIVRHRFALHKICKRSISEIQKIHGFRRLECRVERGNARNRKWVESLGFSPEGIAKSFGPYGADYVYYARVRS